MCVREPHGCTVCCELCVKSSVGECGDGADADELKNIEYPDSEKISQQCVTLQVHLPKCNDLLIHF